MQCEYTNEPALWALIFLGQNQSLLFQYRHSTAYSAKSTSTNTPFAIILFFGCKGDEMFNIMSKDT